MDGTIFYGLKGRIIAGFMATAGVLTAITAAAHESGLVAFIPEKYRWVMPAFTVAALFLTVFSERVQGGASNPEVRNAAKASDAKNEKEAMNK